MWLLYLNENSVPQIDFEEKVEVDKSDVRGVLDYLHKIETILTADTDIHIYTDGWWV